ncbi:MAG TPA: MG2 domain-containing protein, partial [Chitinophagaceae bacterium]|nr:MG2 domain-containing protein [Chitinophagaceae bacterium]
MKQQTLKILLLVVLASFNLPLFAQRFDSVLNLLDTKYPQEKLYLQFDRGIYSPGETIWFKAYLFTGIYPSALSKTIYAELLDDQGKLLQRKSAPVIMAGAAAAFDLPADLKTHTVYVRAYTRWMLNFDTSFLFVKAIPITNKSKATAAA